MRVLAIIPARYASTRFPGKPLALLGGVSVIERCYREVKRAVDDVVVATDDRRIFEAVEAFSGDVVMTREDHTSGTDRCWEAYTKVARERGDYDIVINVQGDEPFIAPGQILQLVECLKREGERCVEIATLVKPFDPKGGIEALESANSPKVIFDKDMRALYFSRSVIPYLRGVERSRWLEEQSFYKHIGIYGFRVEVLRAVTSLAPSRLERCESLEQLRWLEGGYRIGVDITDIETIGIDTPEDLAAAEIFLANR